MPQSHSSNASVARQFEAVVLLSGGMDSCVCTAIAVHKHGAPNVALLHASYGQRTQARERQSFEAIAISTASTTTHRAA